MLSEFMGIKMKHASCLAIRLCVGRVPDAVTRMLGALLLLGVVIGCDTSAPRFHLDMVHVRKYEDPEAPFTDDQLRNLADILTAVFGTPDDPYMIADANLGIHEVMEQRNLNLAAGPVGSDEFGRAQGLYRQHCAHCHGVSGDGAGPTAAFLNPYPRDYRRGVFKFKSTPIGEKPTDDDLERILRQGIPGTAMPSFDLLADDEVKSLVEYVKYLAIRGEVERNLVLELSELDEDEFLLGEENSEDGIGLVQDTMSMVVGRWQRAESRVTEPLPRPSTADPKTASAEEMRESVLRGHKIFNGVIANCFSCHGDTALGDGQKNLYDDWMAEYDPNDPIVKEELLSLRERPQPIRNLRPRNLRRGVYRGGRRPIDIYWRVSNGIDGAKMPAVPIRTESDPPDKKGLSGADVWDLINYVRSLPYEEISRVPYDVHHEGMQLEKPR
ncbi:MAG: cytochrome c [Pirellulaceae bacterium]|nr:cytochrome c [Pirellulaceae bacterium]